MKLQFLSHRWFWPDGWDLYRSCRQQCWFLLYEVSLLLLRYRFLHHIRSITFRWKQHSGNVPDVWCAASVASHCFRQDFFWKHWRNLWIRSGNRTTGRRHSRSEYGLLLWMKSVSGKSFRFRLADTSRCPVWWMKYDAFSRHLRILSGRGTIRIFRLCWSWCLPLAGKRIMSAGLLLCWFHKPGGTVRWGKSYPQHQA